MPNKVSGALEWQAFEPQVRGLFLSRPNRFAAVVETPQGVVTAHCPNPGRLREILTPGTPVLLEVARSERKTALTLVAAQYRDLWIPLASARANDAAEIYLRHRFPQAKLRREVQVGSSRFDFSLEDAQGIRMIEVKACTLAHQGVAMFPDAPSERATRHLEHLVETGLRPMVIFTTYFHSVRSFTPHLHTDPVFARTLNRLKDQLEWVTCVWQAEETGKARLLDISVTLETQGLEAAEHESGLALAAWESSDQTVFAWTRDWGLWKRKLSQKAQVQKLLGPEFAVKKVNDLRVYSTLDLEDLWKQFSQRYGTWKPGAGPWQELWTPGRPLDTQEFWQEFLNFRHRYWR